MALWHQYPWTNFNELNLDWIMKIIKEIKVVDIPGLDDKINNVYEYIKENLPEIVSELESVIINVKWTGAVGDGETDDTEAVKQALQMSHVIYFPEGRYSLKGIVTNDPVIILGDGDNSVLIPQRKHPQTNQFDTIFDFRNDFILKDVALWADNSVSPETDPKTYNTAAFRAIGVEHGCFDHVKISHIYERFRTGWGGVWFENREGMAITCKDCDVIHVTNCDFSDYGGEELTYFIQSKARYAQGIVIANNNYFHDRPAFEEHGSVFNVYGGYLIFADNNIENINHTYYSGATLVGGSVMNLCGCFTIIANNIINGCTCGNFFDTAEGAYTKSDYVIVTNNICRGNAKHGINFNVRKAWINGNYIEGTQCIQSQIMTNDPAATAQYGGVLCSDPATKFTYDDIIIENNEFQGVANPFGDVDSASYDTMISLGRFPSGQDPIQPRFTIKNNIFAHANTPLPNTIYFACRVARAYIMDNIFRGTGVSYPAFNDMLAFISGAHTVSYLNVIGNLLDLTFANTDAILITGTSDFRSNSYYYIYKNIAIASHATATPAKAYMHTGLSPNPTTDEADNIGFTSENPPT